MTLGVTNFAAIFGSLLGCNLGNTRGAEFFEVGIRLHEDFIQQLSYAWIPQLLFRELLRSHGPVNDGNRGSVVEAVVCRVLVARMPAFHGIRQSVVIRICSNSNLGDVFWRYVVA